MKYLGNDFAHKLANDNTTDTKVIHKFCTNPAVGTTLEDLWGPGGVYTWLQSAVQLEVISGSADDTIAGSGAQKVTIEGLNASFNEISETVNMNGASASAPTVQTFIRVNRAYVSQTGTYQATTLTASIAGAITVRTAGAGATHCQLVLEAGTYFGVSKISRHTVPAGYTGFLHSINASANSTSEVNVYAFIRERANITSSTMMPKQVIWMCLGLMGSTIYLPEIPIVLPQYTDIWMAANVDITTASIEGNYELVLIKSKIIDQW